MTAVGAFRKDTSGRYPVKPPEQGTSKFRLLHFNKQFGLGLWKKVDKVKS